MNQIVWSGQRRMAPQFELGNTGGIDIGQYAASGKFCNGDAGQQFYLLVRYDFPIRGFRDV